MEARARLEDILMIVAIVWDVVLGRGRNKLLSFRTVAEYLECVASKTDVESCISLFLLQVVEKDLRG